MALVITVNLTDEQEACLKHNLLNLNKWVQDEKPWEIQDENTKKIVLYNLKEGILQIAELLWPFIPETSEKIKKQFSAKKIKKGKILFEKI